MCGAIGGGSLSMSDAANAAVDQRYYACSHAGSLVYPYGNTYDPTACNGADYGTGKATAAGSLPSCEGGYPGLFDLTGNVEEWQDACDGTTGPLDNCLDGSGAFDYPGSGPTGTRCDFYDSDSRSVQYYDIGIRCCYP
jgi:formylglycine-generating enzyme required for sulfatase activity